MAIELLEEMLLGITSGTLLSASSFEGSDLNAVLDARDRDIAFEREWLRIRSTIDCQWAAFECNIATKQVVEDIRREAFLAVSRATRCHEIAGYVSDDFDLITRAIALGIHDPWLHGLWGEYNQGRFPYPDTSEPDCRT